MNKKLERERNGPSWTEVILGALLSVVLGVALGAVYLVLKPVATVKELPKEPVADTVYYVEGSRDATKGKLAAAKQKTFLQGGAVALNEDELNTLFAPAAPAAKPGAKPGDKAAAAEAPPSDKAISAGAPNFRIRDGVLQIGVPLHLRVFGFEQQVLVIARGKEFAKLGDTVAFQPSEFLVGSCPLQRVPAAQAYFVKQILASAATQEALATAWGRVASVSVEGTTLKLAVQ